MWNHNGNTVHLLLEVNGFFLMEETTKVKDLDQFRLTDLINSSEKVVRIQMDSRTTAVEPTRPGVSNSWPAAQTWPTILLY